MIYASDLDRTLIYSKTFIDMHPSKVKLRIADESRVNSYIDSKVFEKLVKVNSCKNVEFIPVTTRSIEEYKRTHIYKELHPEWAITTSGGRILHFGEVYKPWEEYIEGSIDANRLETVKDAFNSMESVEYASKIIDGRYAFSKTSNRELTKIELEALRNKFTDFKFILDKNKIYGVPNSFGKDRTLIWLKTRLNETELISSGDSEFDVPMLSVSDICFIPTHHSIKELDKKLKSFKSRVIMVNGGVESPNKTLEYVMSTI